MKSIYTSLSTLHVVLSMIETFHKFSDIVHLCHANNFNNRDIWLHGSALYANVPPFKHIHSVETPSLLTCGF